MNRRLTGTTKTLIPSGILYPLTITVDILLAIDLLRIDPLPFVDELILIVVGFFLNRAALRRLGWWPSPAPEGDDQAEDE
jgi:hypothetical protein